MPRKKANPEDQENMELDAVQEDEIMEDMEEAVSAEEAPAEDSPTEFPLEDQPPLDEAAEEAGLDLIDGQPPAEDSTDIPPAETAEEGSDDFAEEEPFPEALQPGPDESIKQEPSPQPEAQPEEEPPARPTRRRTRRTAAEPAAESEPEQVSVAEPARGRRRRAAEPAPSQSILSIDEESKVQSAEDKEAYLWMELRNSLRTKRPLTGILGGVERTPNGLPLAIVYYKDKRIVIPASEMNINLEEHAGSTEREMNNRYAQILSWMMGAEIEFTVSGLDKRSGTVVASRRDAMLRKQRHFFLTPGRNGQPLVQEGATAEARVIAVSEGVVRVEVFGVEAPVYARDVAWEWVDDCNDYYDIGDRVLVKIMSIDRGDPRNIRMTASIRETIPNPARENIKKCVVQGKYIGKVSDVDRNAIYVRLNVGVNAIALAVHDRRTPCRKDDVSFVVTRIDEDAGIAIGIITRIIKQYL